MKAARRNALVVMSLMGVAAAGAVMWKPTAKLADTRAKVDLEQMFPRAFGDWTMDTALPVQLVAPDVQQLLATIYSQTLSRSYVNSKGDRIMLSVAYGGDQSDATRAHRPEVCYPVQGFQILSSQVNRLTVPGHQIRVRQLVARLGGRVEPITYWVVVGDQIALSGPEQKLAQLSFSTRGLVPDGMLIRVSNIDADAVRAYKLHATFITAMSHAIRADLQPQVIGKSAA